MHPPPAHTLVDGSGPPIVLIHGALSSNRQWERNLAALSSVGRPVLIELYGHGGSPAPAEPAAYRPEQYVERLEALRRSLGSERWALIGYSLGARITFEYALTHPEHTLAHIVTNSLSGFATPAWIEATGRGLSQVLDSVEEKGRAAIEAMPIHPRNSSRLDDEMREGLCADLAGCDPRGVVLTSMETALAPPLEHRMRGNRVPTLLVCGRFEERFQPRRDWALANVPHLEVVDVDAAHAVNLEAAEAFNEAACGFLRRQIDAASRP